VELTPTYPKIMNKTLITSICAAALTSSASAFTLDLTPLVGTTIGNAVITQDGFTFAINQVSSSPPGSASGQITAGGVLIVLGGATVAIDYDQTLLCFTGTDFALGSVVTDSNGVLTVTEGAVLGVNFETIESKVPEPSSTALLGLGGLALILRRRK